MSLYWTCLACTTVGDSDKTAETHTRKTGHTTLTGTDPAVLASIRERVCGEAA